MEQRSMQRTQRAAERQTQVNVPDVFDEEYDDVWPTRLPSSTRRYRSDAITEAGRGQADVQGAYQGERPGTRAAGKNAVPARRTANQTSSDMTSRRSAAETEEFVSRRSDVLSAHGETRPHWLIYAGLALVIMMLGWAVLNAVGNWWGVTQDDWHYGRPRTFQTDCVVGHADSPASPSHYIALNLNRHIQIIEFPGGDATKAKVYIGPILIGLGQDLSAVTLSFKDVNGDGKLDMIITVQDSYFVFINDNAQFRPQHQGENIQL